MPADEFRLLAGFLLGVLGAAAATPLAIRLAFRLEFLDRPSGWKEHAVPTPYLGGSAVVAGFMLAVFAAGAAPSRLAPVAAVAVVFFAIGTLDDKWGVSALARVTLEAAAGALLWAADLGWAVSSSEPLNCVLSALWIVGVVNALNLLDLMDGVAGTVAAVSSAGAAVLAGIQGDTLLAAMALALSGACVGFLPYNLKRPSRIFLGDGGSMPIGFILGAVMMAIPQAGAPSWSVMIAALLLVGFPLLDMTFRIISRLRRRISLLTGGTDSLANHLQRGLGTPRAVATVLGLTQALLSLLAVGAHQLDRGLLISAGVAWFGVGTGAVVMLEKLAWGPRGTSRTAHGPPPEIPREPRALPVSIVEGTLIAFLAGACGLSPFLYGFYNVSVWGPIALGMLAGLLGLVLARPASPRSSALIATGGLVGIWIWSALSSLWSESADQATMSANRWLLYAALFSSLVLLLRTDRLCRILIGAAATSILALGIYIAMAMAAGSGADLFIGGRLNEPLGYVNGQAGYLLLGVWPMVAIAERIERTLTSAVAVSGGTLLLGLVVLSQTRAVLPAAAFSAAVILALVPGRTLRLWVLLAMALGVAACLGPLLSVYAAIGADGQPSASVVRQASVALIVASVAAGVVWGLGVALARHLSLRVSAVAKRLVAFTPVALLVVLAAAVAVSAQDPVGKVEREYRAFVRLDRSTTGTTRFVSGAGNRYDYWRVAADQFADSPALGVGAGNYDRTYFIQRRTKEDIRQPHSLPLQVLGELGLVGGLLLVIFLSAGCLGLWRRARGAAQSGGDHGLAVAAGGLALVWLVHTSVDWLHLIPGVTGIALCAIAALVSPWRAERKDVAGRGPFGIAAVVTCVALVILGAVMAGRSALADHYRAQGQESLISDPERARRKAFESLKIDDEPLSAYYLLGAAEARLGRYGPSRRALFAATRREPHDFLPWALLGDLAVRRGDLDAAKQFYRKASSLNPLQENVAALARDPSAALVR